jgi:PEGA domain
MTVRWTAITLGAIVLAAAAQVRADDDKAVPRGGGGGGSQSSGAADRHPSGGASSSSASSPSSSSGSGDQSTSFAVPRSGPAARHPRPGTGTGARYYGSPYYGSYGNYGYGYAYPYYPYYYPYNNYYGSLYFGYSPYYYSGFYGYWPYAYASSAYGYGHSAGSLRLLVEPRETRVYVDGYYAGIVDDFDGIFQRMNLSPGRHELTFKLEGFRSYRVRVYAPLDQTVKVHHRMVPGSGSQTDEATVGVPMDEERYGQRDERSYQRDDRGAEDRPRPEESYGAGERGDMGSLRLDVRPSDATVYVDGEFKGTSQQLRALSLGAGRHHVEIVRPGYRTVERDVEIRAGQTTDLGVDLER